MRRASSPRKSRTTCPCSPRAEGERAVTARRIRALAGTLLVIAALALAARVGLSSSSATGRLAPALPREALVGAHLSLTRVLAGASGRPVLVVFGASWCGPCA